MNIKLFFIVFLCFLTVSSWAEELLKTTSTWEGSAIIYPDGQAEVTSKILKIGAGETTPFHCHPVPTLGYILKGSVEVETKAGKKKIFSAGESAVEVLKTLHRGKAINGPVEIVVFYAGATGIPTTVLPNSEHAAEYCDN